MHGWPFINGQAICTTAYCLYVILLMLCFVNVFQCSLTMERRQWRVNPRTKNRWSFSNRNWERYDEDFVFYGNHQIKKFCDSLIVINKMQINNTLIFTCLEDVGFNPAWNTFDLSRPWAPGGLLSLKVLKELWYKMANLNLITTSEFRLWWTFCDLCIDVYAIVAGLRQDIDITSWLCIILSVWVKLCH